MAEPVWITGASSGIGRALALEMAKAGHVVAVSARNADALAMLAAEGEGGRIRPFVLDVTDGEAVAVTAGRIEATLGPIAIAVLCAGTHHPVDGAAFKADELAALTRTNIHGTATCLEVLIARMIARGGGRIAVVSSVAGYRGLPTSAYYGATKAALINLTESLKFDLDRHGLTLQLIDPGFVRTPLTDKNEFAMPMRIEPEDAARRIARGLRGNAFEITFPRRFTYLLKFLRLLPYRLYFPLVAWATRK